MRKTQPGWTLDNGHPLWGHGRTSDYFVFMEINKQTLEIKVKDRKCLNILYLWDVTKSKLIAPN